MLRFSIVKEHEVNADDNERDTQPLSHVETHIVFKADLILFEEFYKETECENSRQAESEEETAMQLFAVILIEIHHYEEKQEVGNCFVQLCRMAGKHVYPFEDESPGHIGRLTDDFRIHQVGQTDAAGGDRSGYGNHIHYIHVVHFGLPAVEPEGDHQPQCTTVAGKSFITGEFPSSVGQKSDRKYHFPKSFEAGQVGLRIVKQAMTQSGTDKDAEETVEKQGIELLLIYLFITVLIMNDDISQKDANRP